MTPELRALNEAAYAAAKAARKLGDPLASELTQLARRTDEMVDGLPPRAPHALSA